MELQPWEYFYCFGCESAEQRTWHHGRTQFKNRAKLFGDGVLESQIGGWTCPPRFIGGHVVTNEHGRRATVPRHHGGNREKHFLSIGYDLECRSSISKNGLKIHDLIFIDQDKLTR